MAILGNKNNLIDDDIEQKDEYTIPAVIRHDEKGLSLKKSIFLSTVLHPTVVGAIWLMIFILALMGITFSIFERPKPKMTDIEFVLVDNLKEQMPLNKKTPFRSDKNTRTGGKRDMTRKVSMPSPSPAKKSVQQKSTPGPKANKPSQKVHKQIQPKNIFQSLMQPKASQEAKPQPPSARPSLKPPSVPRPVMKPSSPFTVPVPKGGTIGKAYSTGPIGGHGTTKSGGSSSGSGRYAPVPSLAPTGGGGSTGSRLSRGSSGSGTPGNPGGGGGAPGIDSLREPDFGPYMRELQRRIKMNWEPPKGNESKRVVLLFKIAKDGRLLSLKVFKSSGLPNADRAALNAVELTAPFKPLPADYRNSSIDIQFTFDYNVFGASGY
ncbi:MAG: TonB family protein [Candidatus Gastranaerophilales bacterium]|nr:TonB family protein [Candidatus Gastranaerophilales bacterium]